MSSSLNGLLSLSKSEDNVPSNNPDELLQRFREFQFEIQKGLNDRGEEFHRFKKVDCEFSDSLLPDGTMGFLDALIDEDDSIRYELIQKNGAHFWRTATIEQVNERPPVRYVVIGNVDASKSTTIGVLSDPDLSLDDGRGAARARIMIHQHEVESGRTSTTSSYPITVSDPESGYSKQIELVDVAGHEKYLKSAIKGVTKHFPDYAILLVEASNGFSVMSKEHVNLAMGKGIPIIIVLTKVDLAKSKSAIDGTLAEIRAYMNKLSSKKIIMKVHDDDSYASAMEAMFRNTGACLPVFSTSNVTGQGMSLLRKFIGHLPARIRWNDTVDGAGLKDGKPLFVIEQTYSVPGVGLVVGGICVSGILKSNDKGVIGPFADGRWEDVRMRSLHHRRKPTVQLFPGQSAGIAIKCKLTRDDFRHGLLLSTEPLPTLREVRTRVRLFGTKSITLTKGYAPMLECSFFRQVAKVINVESDKPDTTDEKTVLRVGESGIVTFRMLHRPIYCESGMRFLIRDGKIRGIGIIENST